MGKPNQVQEPSMEEILASIRRIISDDDGDASTPVGRAKPANLSTEAIDALFGSRTDDPVPTPQIPAPIAPPSASLAPARPAAAPRAEAPAARPPAAPAPSWVPAPTKRPASNGMAEPVRSPTEPAPKMVAEPVAAAPAARETRPIELPVGKPLLSPGTDAAVNGAFERLAGTQLSGNGRTLDDLVKDMLRPMLKDWLDSHLPPLVERLVRDEIERVSRSR